MLRNFFNSLKDTYYSYLLKSVFKYKAKDLKNQLTLRQAKIKNNIFEYFKTKGQGYSNLFFAEDGKWNFNENNSTISFALPQINLYIQVHSHLCKSYSTLDLMGVKREDWEAYQKEYNTLRHDIEVFAGQVKYIEFFWDDPIDYISVAKKIQVTN
jgi:hypothetical protein